MTETVGDQHLTSQETMEFAPKHGNRIGIYFAVAILLLVIVAGLFFAIAAMINHPDQTETVRDIVIIFMAMEMLIIGCIARPTCTSYRTYSNRDQTDSRLDQRYRKYVAWDNPLLE